MTRKRNTIKAGSGVVELGIIEKFTHVVEDALDKLRSNEIQVSDDLINTMLNCCERLNALLDLVVSGSREPGDKPCTAGEALANELRGLLGGAVAPSMAETPQAETAAEVETERGVKTMNDYYVAKF